MVGVQQTAIPLYSHWHSYRCLTGAKIWNLSQLELKKKTSSNPTIYLLTRKEEQHCTQCIWNNFSNCSLQRFSRPLNFKQPVLPAVLSGTPGKKSGFKFASMCGPVALMPFIRRTGASSKRRTDVGFNYKKLIFSSAFCCLPDNSSSFSLTVCICERQSCWGEQDRLLQTAASQPCLKIIVVCCCYCTWNKKEGHKIHTKWSVLNDILCITSYVKQG